MSIAGDIADERCEKQIKLLEAKILSYRQILEKIVTERDMVLLAQYTNHTNCSEGDEEYRQSLIKRTLKRIKNNPIMKEFDKHFEIKTNE